MNKKDTMHLLLECDSGSKMAVTSIDEILERVTDKKLKELLSKSQKEHTAIGNEIHDLLNKMNKDGKDPSYIAKSMAWMKSNMKMTMDNSDSTVADLITDGCNMGIKSLHKYLNEYKNADKEAKELCNKLVAIEEKLSRKLRPY